MTPKGNRTERRGHRAPVGGEKSKGSLQKSVRLPIEVIKKIERRIGRKKGAFSILVRDLIEAYLAK
jgi:hypothetical protein